MTLENKIWNFR